MNYEALREKLMALDVEGIMEFRDKHPGKVTLIAFCNSIIDEKRNAEEMAVLHRELDELLAEKNAPDGVAAPSQGNETR